MCDYIPECDNDTTTERDIDGKPQGLCHVCATAFDCGERQHDRHRRVVIEIRNLMIEGDDWREQRSGADVIEAVSLILDEQGFGPTADHVEAPAPKLYEVTVREHVETVRTRRIQAHSVEDAREQAEADDWRDWQERAVSEVTNAEIENIEEVS